MPPRILAGVDPLLFEITGPSYSWGSHIPLKQHFGRRFEVPQKGGKLTKYIPSPNTQRI